METRYLPYVCPDGNETLKRGSQHVDAQLKRAAWPDVRASGPQVSLRIDVKLTVQYENQILGI